MDTAVHPAQHRAHARFWDVRGRRHRGQPPIDRAEGHPPHAGNPLAIRQHGATVPPQHSAWQRPAAPAATSASGRRPPTPPPAGRRAPPYRAPACVCACRVIRPLARHGCRDGRLFPMMRSVAGRWWLARVPGRRRPGAPVRWPRRHCVRSACRVRADVRRPAAMRVVAIEEHHIVPEMRSRMDLSLLPPAFRARLDVTADERLADMDAAGIDVQVLSVMLPMPRMLPAGTAVPLAVKINGELHGMVTAHPDRFAAFALLPVTVPDAAADELERAVSELGFAGAMISGTIGGRFLDDPIFAPVLETAARLDVPVYLHPGPPPQPVAEVYYAGFAAPVSQALATAAYGWHYETSLHALRMILGGVFDRLPGLKVILGHLGEGIPFHLPRIDDTLTPLAGQLAKPVSGYFREHFWITTSGYFYDGPFRLTREMFGDDRLIFSVDYPLLNRQQARDWFDRLDLAPGVREKIAHGTADNLLRLR